MEKLSVALWGLSISAEGLWAIAGAIITVGIVAVAAVVARRRSVENGKDDNDAVERRN
jgi:hypothetical protein